MDVIRWNIVVHNRYVIIELRMTMYLPFRNLFSTSIQFLQVQKLCLPTLDIFLNCQSRYGMSQTMQIFCPSFSCVDVSLIKCDPCTQLVLTLCFLQIAFTSVVYPSLILAYMGQAAYLSKHHVIESDYQIGFYVSVPGTWAAFFIYYYL